jgi:hypothetical protein
LPFKERAWDILLLPVGAALGIFVSGLTPFASESFWAKTFHQDDKAQDVVEAFWSARSGADWRQASRYLVGTSTLASSAGRLAEITPADLDVEVEYDRATVRVDGTRVLQPDGRCQLLDGTYTLVREGGVLALGGEWKIRHRDVTDKPLPKALADEEGWTCSHRLTDYERPLGFQLTASASSEQPQARAEMVVDDPTGTTYWRPKQDDLNPQLTLQFRYAARVTRIDVTVGLGKDERAFQASDKPNKLEIVSDHGESFVAYLNPNESDPQKLRHAFKRLVRTLTIKVLNWDTCVRSGPTIRDVSIYRNPDKQSVPEPRAVIARRRDFKPAARAFSSEGACPPSATAATAAPAASLTPATPTQGSPPPTSTP